jgi:hypothetical protein
MTPVTRLRPLAAIVITLLPMPGSAIEDGVLQKAERRQ